MLTQPPRQRERERIGGSRAQLDLVEFSRCCGRTSPRSVWTMRAEC